MINRSDKEYALLNLMGGELFADDVFTPALAAQYRELLRYVTTHASKHCKFNFCTNLIFENVDNVKEFLSEMRGDGYDIHVSTSYDFVGRFNPTTRQIFLRNLKLFSGEVETIGVVLTAPNIKEFIRDQDPTFHHLYEQYGIYFDFYTPQEDAAVMCPSDEQMLAAFYYAIDHYPKIQPINTWFSLTNTKMSCKTAKNISPKGEYQQCGEVPSVHTIKLFKQPPSPTMAHLEMEFVEQRHCLSCEYFKSCSLGCFLLHAFNYTPGLECMFKMAYDKIHKGIIDQRIYDKYINR
jgi:radical SAM protein with 4Fe4S-binding SPASM domain